MFDVETNKVVIEVIAPNRGIVENIQIEEDDFVVSEQVVMNLCEKDASYAAAVPKDVKYIETII
ncbi:biotin/lipoyl-containing protein [Shewanella gelidii]|uniref:Lipoyl-binding domain-containing protein n=1 Tax=Shewanella gelidii TaxID=1642821 RepID=A0A917JS46_9GAMM|nr:biotin/lipoyl-containing protein [Shewanella gelidii]MCL1098467.1 hypothetical protein [Shewanella gelidii]GGI82550.1 hypothetical protein GCM10009332_19700 [Shewanella gelidii]